MYAMLYSFTPDIATSTAYTITTIPTIRSM